MYLSGEYLRYTECLEDEANLIYGTCEEFEKVNAYAEYIEEVSEGQNILGTISIFESTDNKDSFSERNIEKSAADHIGMENIRPAYMLSKGIEETLRFSFTDILAIILVIYFSMQLIWEEKETGLYAVTRASRRGRGGAIAAKLMALGTHAFITTVVLNIIKYVWFGINAGFTDLSLPIQSVAAYMESGLRCNLLEMTLASLITKTAAVLLIGFVVLRTAQWAKMVWIPWFTAAAFIVGGVAAYELIDINSSLAMVKYLSFFGLFHGDRLFGKYINVSLAGSPVSGMNICILFNIILIIVLIATNVLYFLFFFEGTFVKKNVKAFQIKILGRSLLNQEIYKIFIMNKAALVIMLFLPVMGLIHYNAEYRLPVSELYYQNFMLKIEGSLNADKEKLIKAEKEKYDEAFAEIEKIEGLEAEGTIDFVQASSMNAKYQMLVSLYPQFEKVLIQYGKAKAENTPFLYDTGYREIMRMNGGKGLLVQELLAASIAIILAFGSALSMEQEKQSWMLLSTSFTGRNKIQKSKWSICLFCSCLLALYAWILRWVMINNRYPMRKMLYSSECLLGYDGLGVPLVILLLLEAVLHILIYAGITAIVLYISGRRERTIEVYVFSTMTIVLPLVLMLVL